MMRLDKFLADHGCGTRSEVKKSIRRHEVSVNGSTDVRAEQHIDPENDVITFLGEEIVYQKYVYLMLHKPAGCISATSGNTETVMDYIAEPYKDLFPCGRLDKDTEGLLLITNDGPLAHELLSPKKGIEKEYFVRYANDLSPADIEKAGQGIVYQKEAYKPARITEVKDHTCHIIITEGRFHEIKQIFAALGNEVLYLKRLRMKNLKLDENLAPGEYRYLSEEEINDLREGC